MLLHTGSYLLFLLVVILAYWSSPSRYRKPLLLLASYGFYTTFDLRFLALLVALTLANYLLGWAIPGSRYARLLAWFSVLLNLGALAVFKWADFFMEGLSRTFHALGFFTLPVGLQLLVPIGISFITFQAISYTTEIYRKKLEPAAWMDFAVYMAFFPKLVAGPLVRPEQFLSQLKQPSARPDRSAAMSALGLLLLGLFKKIVIADSLAGLSDVAFRAAARDMGIDFLPSALFWQGFYLYSFLIYADFSGYTDIARSSAILLGFNLPENFRQPYLSENITLFWNRWHMSLTQWFREYLFFPLSRGLLIKTGRRHARLIQIAVTLITMTLIGLWHGAAWTFVVWGVWHGVLLSINQVRSWKVERRWQKLGLGIVTFHLVGIGWVLFGSSSFEAAERFLRGMFTFTGPAGWAYYLPPVLLCAILVFGIDLVQGGYVRIPAHLQQAVKPVLVTASVLLLVCLAAIYMVNGGDARPFIYGQF